MSKVKTILFAEDDQVLLTLYRKHLQQAGYHVIPAQDGLEAMRNLSMFVPDLVILDLMMPKFNGEEVLEYVCGREKLAIVPLIILSSNNVVDVGHEHLLQRADRRLLKYHCTPAILLDTIKELFSTQLEEDEEPVRPTQPTEDSFGAIVQSATN